MHAHRWLNSSSAAYSDTAGAALTMREAISEHVFRLMDASNVELLLKVCACALCVHTTPIFGPNQAGHVA